MPSAINTPTGASQNGDTNKLMATLLDGGTASGVSRSTIYFNGADTVPLAPAMNEPSKSTQNFQNGSRENVTVDGGYQNDTIVCEYDADDYSAIDAARAKGLRWKIQRLLNGSQTPSDDGIAAILTVSDGPTLTVKTRQVPTMTVTITYVGTQDNPLDSESI